MFMTASRITIDEKPALKLNIHDYTGDDIPFLDSLGINRHEEETPGVRYTHIHSQDDFLRTRAAILEQYDVLEEKGPKVYLAVK